ncbi:unnamed protein product, partial [Strongylus vulgaris]
MGPTEALVLVSLAGLSRKSSFKAFVFVHPEKREPALIESREPHKARTTLPIVYLCTISVAIGNDEVFANTPGAGPYYVKEHMIGPTLKCSVRSKFADRARYQVQWQRYNKGNLRYISINDQLLDSAHFELVGDISSGVYDLKLKDIAQNAVEGSYYCT